MTLPTNYAEAEIRYRQERAAKSFAANTRRGATAGRRHHRPFGLSFSLRH